MSFIYVCKFRFSLDVRGIYSNACFVFVHRLQIKCFINELCASSVMITGDDCFYDHPTPPSYWWHLNTMCHYMQCVYFSKRIHTSIRKLLISSRLCVKSFKSWLMHEYAWGTCPDPVLFFSRPIKKLLWTE